MTKIKGRIVTCSNCSRPTSHGTSQVYKKILFHFCAGCWSDFRWKCDEFMTKAGAQTSRPIKAT